MKIELRKLKIFLPGSQETTCFVADLYVNDIKTAYVNNEGCGGCTNISSYENGRQVLEQAEAFCKAMPPKTYPELGTAEEPFVLKMDLENYVDDIVDQEVSRLEAKKFEKRLLKDQLKYLCFTNISEGKPITEYITTGWKNRTIAEFVANPVGMVSLEKAITQKLNEGFRLLNTNLPASLLAIGKPVTA